MQLKINSSASTDRLSLQKVNFTIRKKVRFGLAVYVCGSTIEVGQWNPQEAVRLTWNQGDLWTGTVTFASSAPTLLEYKYLVLSWDSSSAGPLEWEVGQHNRLLDLKGSKSSIYVNDKWNMDVITLHLLTRTSRSPQSQRYYVTGNISQLGAWKDRKLMKRNLNNSIPNHLNLTQQENSSSGSPKQFQILSFTFELFRLQTHFYYYYMRAGELTETQRKPGRVFKFDDQLAHYPSRLKVLHPHGEIVIIDQSSINGIKVSKITSNIYVGSYLKTKADIQKLKKKNINTILSLQNDRDFKKNGVSSYYLSILCQEYNIKYYQVSIEDMNGRDFIANAQNGVKIMEQALNDQRDKIYVHCTAGIYRSPQMIALYLIKNQKFKLEEAISLLKEKHSYAKPSCRIIKEALYILETKNKMNQPTIRS